MFLLLLLLLKYRNSARSCALTGAHNSNPGIIWFEPIPRMTHGITEIYLVWHWKGFDYKGDIDLGPVDSKSQQSENRGYGLSQWESPLHLSSPLIGWAHTQNDPRGTVCVFLRLYSPLQKSYHSPHIDLADLLTDWPLWPIIQNM